MPQIAVFFRFGAFLYILALGKLGSAKNGEKCVIFYLGRVPSYFFPFKKSVFLYIGRAVQKNYTSPPPQSTSPGSTAALKWLPSEHSANDS